MSEALLAVRDLTVSFRRRGSSDMFHAVKNVSLEVGESETVALVGESGSGKTTISRAVLGLERVSGGTIEFAGRDITARTSAERKRLSRDLQAVFQDPFGSLNPTKTIGTSLCEMLLNQDMERKAIIGRAQEMLERVGLPHTSFHRFPVEFSGGQRQRIAIARALMARPRLVVCDEPVSALDLSIQAQILNLLMDLQRDLGLSYLFISHDLGVVRHMAQNIVVLYHGEVVERGNALEVCADPQQRYTQRLVEAAGLS